MTVNDPREERVHDVAERWNVEIERVAERSTAILGYGSHRPDGARVVLKIVTGADDEWSAGAVLAAFRGRGAVTVVRYEPGAMLMEQIIPGTSLADSVLDDESRTDVLADVMQRLDAAGIPDGTATAAKWGAAFERYLGTRHGPVPMELAASAQQMYSELCATQRNARLLHGDLQHYNVILDERRGWMAIDPKGVTGELAYETGALFRNPIERPDVFLDTSVIERRASQLAARLDLDAHRILRWAFAQAVLSAIWCVEDRLPVAAVSNPVRLARALQSISVRTGY